MESYVYIVAYEWPKLKRKPVLYNRLSERLETTEQSGHKGEKIIILVGCAVAVIFYFSTNSFAVGRGDLPHPSD